MMVRAARWQKVIEECRHRPENITARKWMEDNHINPKTYYVWQRRLREAAFNAITQGNPTSVPADSSVTVSAQSLVDITPAAALPSESGNDVSKSHRPDATLRIGNASIELSNSASEQLIKSILRGLHYVG